MEHFHKYLYGQAYHLPTDHSVVTWLLSFNYLEWKQHGRYSISKRKILLPSTAKAGNKTMQMAIHEDYAKRSVSIATNPRHWQITSRYKLLQL
jgi:hypothetical protein